ncbi:hypothetical protein F4808DRAFT_243979 [Astrocystis sublimbata]|nr:hypothetical protein F4808DRAFT_243979 [Astrocystis sublimbata]
MVAIQHVTEGDLSRATTLYLLHPVNQVLSSIPQFKDTIICYSERTVKTTKINRRSDIPYNRLERSETRYFTILEFKKKGIVINQASIT